MRTLSGQQNPDIDSFSVQFSNLMTTPAPNDSTPPTQSAPSLIASESRCTYLKICYQAVCDAIACEVDVQYNEPNSVQLVAVSKLMPPSDIQALYDLGHRHFGENYVQELVAKAQIVRLVKTVWESIY